MWKLEKGTVFKAEVGEKNFVAGAVLDMVKNKLLVCFPITIQLQLLQDLKE